MPSFEHLTIQDRDTKSNILAIGTANNAVPGQWYLATNVNEYYFGAQDGSLIGPLIPQNAQFIQSIADTNGIDLTVTANELSAALKLDAAADNLLSLSAAGLYAKKYTIHPDSQNYLEIDASNQIKTKQLLITDTTVDTTETSLADHITTSGYGVGNLIYEEGDIIVLTQVQETWIHHGGTAGDATDFTEISADVTDSYIRNLFSATDGVDYNPSTGIFNLDVPYARQIISGISPVNYNSANGEISIETNGIGNTHLRQGAAASVIGRSAGTVGNVADIASSADDQFLVRRSGALQFGALQASDIQAVGAITTASNGLTKVGSDVKLGGVLTEDTTINGNFFYTVDKEQIIYGHNSDTYEKVLHLGLVATGSNKINLVWDRAILTATATWAASIYEVTIRANNEQQNKLYSKFLIYYNPENHTSQVKRLDAIDDKVSFGVMTYDSTNNLDLLPLHVNISGSNIFKCNIKLVSGSSGSGDSLRAKSFIEAVSSDSWTADTYPSITKTGITGPVVISSTSFPSSSNLYILDITGDTRITSGLWVGGGSPPADLPDGVITAVTGFRINNAATSGQYLRGNGTNFVASNLLASDINGIVPIANGGNGLGTLGTPGQILKVNAGGTALEYADEAAADPYTFENGLTKDGSAVVRLGGDLTQNTTIGLQAFNLHFSQTTGKVTFFSATAGPSDFNIHDKDLEIISANPGTVLRGLILTKADGTRVHATVGPNNQWEITPI